MVQRCQRIIAFSCAAQLTPRCFNTQQIDQAVTSHLSQVFIVHIVPAFHRAYSSSSSGFFWILSTSSFFSLSDHRVRLTYTKKNLLKSGSKNMSACKVAPFVHFEHFIFLLYSLVPGGVASCSARSVIAYSGGIIGLFALLVHLPTHLLVYIIAVYSVLGQAGTGSLVLPSLIISRWLPCVHFIVLAPDTQPAIPRSGSRGFPAFNQRQIKKNVFKDFSSANKSSL